MHTTDSGRSAFPAWFQAKAAGTAVTGGQSVHNPWPIIGGVAKSVVKAADFIMPRHAVAGDVLVLTKPLGTQVAVNAKQWMRENKPVWQTIQTHITPEEVNRAFGLACQSMSTLNREAARLMYVCTARMQTALGISCEFHNL
jgi:selenide,water dikinase